MFATVNNDIDRNVVFQHIIFSLFVYAPTIILIVPEWKLSFSKWRPLSGRLKPPWLCCIGAEWSGKWTHTKYWFSRFQFRSADENLINGYLSNTTHCKCFYMVWYRVTADLPEYYILEKSLVWKKVKTVLDLFDISVWPICVVARYMEFTTSSLSINVPH